MEITPDITGEEASAIAAHKAKSLQQAVTVERELQNAEVIEETVRRVGNIVQERFEHVLATGSEQEKSMILARVPYICQDIKNINQTLGKIQESITYMPLVQKLVFAFTSVILLGVLGVAGAAIMMYLRAK